MSVTRNLAAVGGFAVAVAVAAPAAAVVPLVGSINLEVFAKANGNVQSDPFDSQSWSNIGAHRDGPKDLGHIVLDPEAKTPNGKIDVKGHGDLSARWDSASAGSVTVDVGRVIDIQNSAPQLSLLINSGWNYLFTAEQDATFSLDYLFTGAGQLKGLGQWAFELKSGTDTRHIDEFQNVDLTPAFDSGERHVAFALTAGRTYSVSLFGNDQNRPTDGSHLNGSYQAQFAWSITPEVAAAPEPAQWSLMILGFGLVGSALRRRRLCRGPAWVLQLGRRESA